MKLNKPKKGRKNADSRRNVQIYILTYSRCNRGSSGFSEEKSLIFGIFGTPPREENLRMLETLLQNTTKVVAGPKRG